MKIKNKLLAFLGILAGFFLMASPTYAYTWNQVNTSGFGEANNIDGSAIEVYNSKLYVSTYNISTGCEVWESSDGTSWTRVDPGAPGPGGGGFGDANNVNCGAMEVNDYGSGDRLYVGTTNFTTGAEVWEYNGTTWQQVNSNGFGDANNNSVVSFTVYNSGVADRLNVGVDYYDSIAPLNTMKVLEYNGTTWSQVNTNGFGNPNNETAGDLAVYGGLLYAAANNFSTGTEVWELNGATWAQSNDDGFDFDTNNVSTFTMNVYNGGSGDRLYAGTHNITTGGELWEYNNATLSWSKVGPDGLGDSNNATIYSSVIHSGSLFLGTGNVTSGTEVQEYSGSLPFVQANLDGFDVSPASYSNGMVVFGGELFVAASNAEVWKMSSSNGGGAVPEFSNIAMIVMTFIIGVGTFYYVRQRKPAEVVNS